MLGEIAPPYVRKVAPEDNPSPASDRTILERTPYWRRREAKLCSFQSVWSGRSRRTRFGGRGKSIDHPPKLHDDLANVGAGVAVHAQRAAASMRTRTARRRRRSFWDTRQ